MVPSVKLIEPDPEMARLDAEFGRALAQGPKGIVFKDSQVPDFRKDYTEEPELDAANSARYDLYLQRLSSFGADTLRMRQRVNHGMRRLYAFG